MILQKSVFMRKKERGRKKDEEGKNCLPRSECKKERMKRGGMDQRERERERKKKKERKKTERERERDEGGRGSGGQNDF